MFIKKNSSEPDSLDLVIDDVLKDMLNREYDSDEFATMADQVVKLHNLKQDDKSSQISADTLVTVGAHLLGIMLIVGHERANVVTSKAIGFVSKLR